MKTILLAAAIALPTYVVVDPYDAMASGDSEVCTQLADFAYDVAVRRDEGFGLIEALEMWDEMDVERDGVFVLMRGTILQVYDASELSPGLIQMATYLGCMEAMASI